MSYVKTLTPYRFSVYDGYGKDRVITFEDLTTKPRSGQNAKKHEESSKKRDRKGSLGFTEVIITGTVCALTSQRFPETQPLGAQQVYVIAMALNSPAVPLHLQDGMI